MIHFGDIYFKRYGLGISFWLFTNGHIDLTYLDGYSPLEAMIHTKTKGNRIRLLAIKQLEKGGFWVDVVEKTSKWAKQKDLFGLFDLIAIRGQQHKIEFKFIQIKSNKRPPLNDYKKFKGRYGGEFRSYDDMSLFKLSVEIWVYKDRKGWEIIELNDTLPK